MNHSTRKINNSELNLEGIIYGSAPVQAEGTINGFAFYFRARYNEWTFAVSEDSEIDPIDIENMEIGKEHGFFKEAKYKQKEKDAASYMDTETAEKIIIDCLREYVKIVREI